VVKGGNKVSKQAGKYYSTDLSSNRSLREDASHLLSKGRGILWLPGVIRDRLLASLLSNPIKRYYKGVMRSSSTMRRRAVIVMVNLLI